MNRLKYFVFLLTIAGAFSCNPVNKILKNKEQFDKVGREWLKQNPCSNDSTVIYLPSKRDSIILNIPMLIKDTSGNSFFIDSINNVLSPKYNDKKYNCKKQISESYSIGYNKAMYECKIKLSNIKIPAPIIDTLKIILKDKQQINLLTQDLYNCDSELNKEKLKSEKYKGSKDKWFLLFLLACAFLIGSLYFNFKKL
jgi:hypothetical protein